MKVYGIDFTSRPSRRKPLVCLACELEDAVLKVREPVGWTSFEEFEQALMQPGPWIAGIDFPFGQSRKFIENIGWLESWAGYVDYAASLSRERFREIMKQYRMNRQSGDKEHKRKTEKIAGAFSAQKIERPPVGLMFLEGAPRLRRANVTIPGMQEDDPERIVIEAFPSVVARQFIGRRSYKHDSRSEQTDARKIAREDLLNGILSDGLEEIYGLRLKVNDPRYLIEDASGDHLDALFCAVQAAWAWRNRDRNYGIPDSFDSREGWIVDPTLS